MFDDSSKCPYFSKLDNMPESQRNEMLKMYELMLQSKQHPSSNSNTFDHKENSKPEESKCPVFK
jgi:hypothetical protein